MRAALPVREDAEPPQVIARSLRPGLLFLLGGLFLLFVSGGWDGGGDGSRYLILVGLVCCEIASAFAIKNGTTTEMAKVMSWRFVPSIPVTDLAPPA